MAEGTEDTVVVDGGCHVVGLGLEGVDGVAHGDANSRLADHRRVVAAVAEGHRAAGVEALVARHGQDALALIGPAGGDIGKLRVPASRDAVWHARHEVGLVVGGEEGGQLQDVLSEQGVERRGLIEVPDGEHLSEDAVDIALGVVDGHVASSHGNEAVALGPGIVDADGHVARIDGLVAHQLLAHVAQGAVGRDVAVDEMLDGAEIGDDKRGAARGDIDARAVGLGLCQGEDGRGWYLVGLETHQRAVDVEEKSISLCHNPGCKGSNIFAESLGKIKNIARFRYYSQKITIFEAELRINLTALL